MPKVRNLSMKPDAIRKREKRAAEKKVAAQQPRAEDSSKAASGDSPGPQDESFRLSAEDAPKETFNTGGMLGSVLDAIGLGHLAPGANGNKPALLSGPKLDKRRQEFADNVTPIAAALFAMGAAWAWHQLGDIYAPCAPNEEISTRIMAPLVRIYARTAKFVESIDPNTADWFAFLSAFGGYIFSSVQLALVIRAQAEQGDEHGFTRTPETDLNHANGRRPTPEQSTHQNGSRDAGGNGFNPGDLSERERANYERLSALRARDIAARARRSGQYGAG